MSESSCSGVREGVTERPSQPARRRGVDCYIEAYWNYLRLVADSKIDPKLRRRIAASDVVQETMLAAHRDRHRFRGSTEEEFRGWLVSVLTCNILDAEKAQRRRCRDTAREVSIPEIHVEAALVDAELTPGGRAIRSEEHRGLISALERLPAHYRQVILLRAIEQRSFAEIATREGKTVESVRHLWFRGIKRLGREISSDD